MLISISFNYRLVNNVTTRNSVNALHNVTIFLNASVCRDVQ